jgi:hypothetical protein
MDRFKELIYPAELTWSALIKQRAMLDPSSVSSRLLLDTLLEVWEDDEVEDQD